VSALEAELISMRQDVRSDLATLREDIAALARALVDPLCHIVAGPFLCLTGTGTCACHCVGTNRKSTPCSFFCPKCVSPKSATCRSDCAHRGGQQ
jgi:hypothetical protein